MTFAGDNLDKDPLVTVKAQISSIRKSQETKLNYSRTGIRAIYEIGYVHVFTIYQYLLYGSMFNTNYLEFGARSECACKEEFTHNSGTTDVSARTQILCSTQILWK